MKLKRKQISRIRFKRSDHMDCIVRSEKSYEPDPRWINSIWVNDDENKTKKSIKDNLLVWAKIFERISGAKNRTHIYVNEYNNWPNGNAYFGYVMWPKYKVNTETANWQLDREISSNNLMHSGWLHNDYYAIHTSYDALDAYYLGNSLYFTKNGYRIFRADFNRDFKGKGHGFSYKRWLFNDGLLAILYNYEITLARLVFIPIDKNTFAVGKPRILKTWESTYVYENGSWDSNFTIGNALKTKNGLVSVVPRWSRVYEKLETLYFTKIDTAGHYKTVCYWCPLYKGAGSIREYGLAMSFQSNGNVVYIVWFRDYTPGTWGDYVYDSGSRMYIINDNGFNFYEPNPVYTENTYQLRVVWCGEDEKYYIYKSISDANGVRTVIYVSDDLVHTTLVKSHIAPIIVRCTPFEEDWEFADWYPHGKIRLYFDPNDAETEEDVDANILVTASMINISKTQRGAYFANEAELYNTYTYETICFEDGKIIHPSELIIHDYHNTMFIDNMLFNESENNYYCVEFYRTSLDSRNGPYNSYFTINDKVWEDVE